MLGPELEFPPCRTLWLANLPVWVTDSALRGLHLSLIKTHNSSTQGELYGRGGTRNTVGFITVGGGQGRGSGDHQRRKNSEDNTERLCGNRPQGSGDSQQHGKYGGSEELHLEQERVRNYRS